MAGLTKAAAEARHIFQIAREQVTRHLVSRAIAGEPIRRYRARRLHAGLVHGPLWGNGVELVQDRKKQSPPQAASKVQSKGQDTGSALRTVYQRTVDEDVPDAMLDLLSKLK